MLVIAAASLQAQAGAYRNPSEKPLAANTANAVTARSALKFTRVLTSDCMLHRSQLVRIENTDPNRAIRVVMQSYLGKTRSQAATTITLAPASGPVGLGCDGLPGLKRRWQILRAKFVAPGASDRKAGDNT